MLAQYQIQEQVKKLRGIYDKTLQIPIGGTTFYFNIPVNPMVYVSESSGVIYINGSTYWDLELYTFYDLENEFIDQVIQLSKSIGKSVSEVHDVLLDFDKKKLVEKRNFYIKVGDGIIGFYYNLYVPTEKRNGIVEIIPYYKQV